MAAITLYIDWASQPSRAVMSFCEVNKIPYQIKEVRIFKGENKSPEFLKINPNGQVPAMTKDSFKLFESHAILRYLCESRSEIPDHWYPKDPKQRAVVN